MAGQVFGIDPEGGQLIRDLRPHEPDQLLARLAASVQQVVHPLLGLLPLQVARVDKLLDDLLCSRPGHLPEHRAGLDVLPEPVVTCHVVTVPPSYNDCQGLSRCMHSPRQGHHELRYRSTSSRSDDAVASGAGSGRGLPGAVTPERTSA